jgi:hypothetical protein
MKTISGKNAPLPHDTYQADGEPPCPLDICQHLGRTGRFGGWGDPSWTVLHHVTLASMLWMKFYGPSGVHHALMHDFHEAYTGDIPSPIKQCLGKEGAAAVKALEAHLDGTIYAAMNVDPPTPQQRAKVKVVDFACLMVESFRHGTPGTPQRIMQIDYPKLPPSFADEVFECIRESFPHVASMMRDFDGWVYPQVATEFDAGRDLL